MTPHDFDRFYDNESTFQLTQLEPRSGFHWDIDDLIALHVVPFEKVPLDEIVCEAALDKAPNPAGA